MIPCAKVTTRRAYRPTGAAIGAGHNRCADPPAVPKAISAGSARDLDKTITPSSVGKACWDGDVPVEQRADWHAGDEFRENAKKNVPGVAITPALPWWVGEHGLQRRHVINDLDVRVVPASVALEHIERTVRVLGKA